MDISKLNIQELYDMRTLLNTRIAEIESAATTSLLLNIPFPGFDLKPGRNMRSLDNEDAVIQLCVGMGISKDSLVEPKFKGIPNMEKMIKGLSESQQSTIMSHVQVTTTKPSVVFVGLPNE